MATEEMRARGASLGQILLKRNSGLTSLSQTRNALGSVISEGLWQEYYAPPGYDKRLVRHATFESYLTTQVRDGLGWSLEDLETICGKDQRFRNLVDEAMTYRVDLETGERKPRAGERRDLLDNIKEVASFPSGTSTQRAHRVLRNKAPELHAKVLAGEISAHAAMLEGGFRKRTWTVPAEPDDLARALQRKLTAGQIARVVAILVGDA